MLPRGIAYWPACGRRRADVLRAAAAAGLALAGLAVAPTTAAAAPWSEVGDAGSLTADAQVPAGAGGLHSIGGGIDNTRFTNSDEDVYRVCLTGAEFTAATSTGADPKLYLFGSDGRLVAYNDDYASSESRVAVASPAAGAYHLAIVAYPEAPRDGSGNVMFTPGDGPLASWSEGAADSFTYTIALQGVEFCPAPNGTPAAAADAYEHNGTDTPLVVGAASGVLANDSDGDGDALTSLLLSEPAHGTLRLELDGSFSYLPREDFVGDDSFTYSASDGAAQSDAATVTITVHPGCDGRRATIVGTPGADFLRGTAGPDVIAGLGGDDKLRGADGSDHLCAGGGDDKLKGDRGDDYVSGASGLRDRCKGGDGADTHGGGCERLHSVP